MERRQASLELTNSINIFTGFPVDPTTIARISTNDVGAMEKENNSKKVKRDLDAAEPNVIRIKSSGQMNAYIERTERLLKIYNLVKLKASSSAIPKAVSVAEILKRVLPHVHQTASLSLDQTSATPQREPTSGSQASEGKNKADCNRIVSSITILLRLPDPTPADSDTQMLSS